MQRKTIQELTEAAKVSAIQAGYRKTGITNFSYTWNKLKVYAAEKGITHYSHGLGVDFLREHYGIIAFNGLTGHQHSRARAIELLNDVQNSGYVVSRRTKTGYVFPEVFQSVITEYIGTRENAEIVSRSIQTTKLYLVRFSDYLTAQGIKALSEVDMPVIEGFIRSLTVYGKPTINHTLRSVRGLMKYAYDAGFITADKSGLVPHVHYNRRARIPSAYTAEEISRLLATVDRNHPVGKRDHALLLLAARLGLRAGDICGLTFENIKWEENSIVIFQQKTQNMLALPLTEEVGMALVDYLKHGRPATECQCVLVKHVQPYDALNPSSTYTIVSRYFEKSGIPMPGGKKRGPHALRHSLASALLENGVPLPVISEVLGHTNTKATGVYLKIDIENLRKCAISVPFYAEKGKAVASYVED